MNSFFRIMLESAVCLVVFYFFYLWLLRDETYFRLNRFYLVAAVFLSLAIPILKISSPFRVVRIHTEDLSSALAMPASNPTWTIWKTLFLVYGVGFALFLCRFLLHLARLAFMIKSRGVSRHASGIGIVFIEQECTPFSFFNIIFVNSSHLDQRHLDQIIAHERIHIRQYHSFDILLVELLTIVQWFNPFVWPYKRSLKETHEYLADDGVIAQGFNAARYRVLLFEHQIGAKLSEFANTFKQSQIKRRITMMTKNKSRGAARMKLLLALPVIVLLVLAFAHPRLLAVAGTDAAVSASIPGSDEKSDEMKKQEQTAKLKEKLAMVKAKEEDIRTQIEKTSDTAKRDQLKADLEKLLEAKAKIKRMLSEGPSAPEMSTQEIKQEFAKLQDFEKKLKTKLAETNDPEERAELEKKLANVEGKKAWLESHAHDVGHVSSEAAMNLEEKTKYLTEMEMKIKQKLAQADNPQDKEILEKKLAEVQAQQKMLQEKSAGSGAH